jgi:uncharacterized protein YuzE
MEALKLLEDNKLPIEYSYDEEADVLYLSFGPPRPAVGMDIGEGTILRYDEREKIIVGITIIGVGQRAKKVIKSF